MIRTILMYGIGYLILVMLIVMVLPVSSSVMIVVLSLATWLLGSVILYQVLKRKKLYSNTSDSHKSQMKSFIDPVDLSDYKKISSKVPLFFKSAVSDIELYFSSNSLCIVFPNDDKVYYPLEAIVELRRISTRIANSSVWSISISKDEEVMTYSFIHNMRLWNKDFRVFYSLLLEVNPTAVKSKCNWLSI